MGSASPVYLAEFRLCSHRRIVESWNKVHRLIRLERQHGRHEHTLAALFDTHPGDDNAEVFTLVANIRWLANQPLWHILLI